MKILKQRIAKAFGGGTSERGTSNLEIVVWISVVLVIAVGLFLLRDNIAKFINNASTQITGEASRPEGMNEYGFYFGKVYWNDEVAFGLVLNEDGSAYEVNEYGDIVYTYPPGEFTYSNGKAGDKTFSADGKVLMEDYYHYELKDIKINY